jgi:hypothetical protein
MLTLRHQRQLSVASPGGAFAIGPTQVTHEHLGPVAHQDDFERGSLAGQHGRRHDHLARTAQVQRPIAHHGHRHAARCRRLQRPAQVADLLHRHLRREAVLRLVDQHFGTRQDVGPPLDMPDVFFFVGL